jgi:Contractile injection system tube protein/LysM domain
MSNSAGLAKATIVKLDKQNHPVRSESVEVMFNPKELTFTKQNNWQLGQKPKSNVPDFEFSGGGSTTLKIQLFFDTYSARKDVRKQYTDAIYKLMWVDEHLTDKKNKKGRPPTVRFQWGKTIGFDAVITNINQRFTLFLPDDGTPVRAVLDVTFSQVKDQLFYPAQNPTSGGVGGEKVWVVKSGDTLAWIAFNEYNNANNWRLIAETNGLTSVRDLTPGTKLIIPHA